MDTLCFPYHTSFNDCCRRNHCWRHLMDICEERFFEVRSLTPWISETVEMCNFCNLQKKSDERQYLAKNWWMPQMMCIAKSHGFKQVEGN